jgi:hypothetical protein
MRGGALVAASSSPPTRDAYKMLPMWAIKSIGPSGIGGGGRKRKSQGEISTLPTAPIGLCLQPTEEGAALYLRVELMLAISTLKELFHCSFSYFQTAIELNLC